MHCTRHGTSNWLKLVRSYIVGALRKKESRGRKIDGRALLDQAIPCDGQAFTVGSGTTVGWTTDELAGTALVCDGQLVHIAVFARDG